MVERFEGFLGIWKWPLINLILEILARKPLTSGGLSESESPKLENIEEIEWEDYKGRTRRIRIHREVR